MQGALPEHIGYQVPLDHVATHFKLRFSVTLSTWVITSILIDGLNHCLIKFVVDLLRKVSFLTFKKYKLNRTRSPNALRGPPYLFVSACFPRRVWPWLRHPCAAFSLSHICLQLTTNQPRPWPLIIHRQQVTHALYTSAVTSHLFILSDNELLLSEKVTLWNICGGLFPTNVPPPLLGYSGL